MLLRALCVKRVAVSVFLLCALLANGSVLAQTALKDIQFVSMPGNQFEIELVFDDRPPASEVFEIENPARLSMDFPGVISQLEERRYPLQFDLADSVMVLEAQGRTRMVVNLSRPTTHSARIQGNSLFVLIGDGSTAAAPVARAVPRSTRGESRVPAADITDVDFRLADNGAGQIIIDLARSSTKGEIHQLGSKLELGFSDATLAESLQMRLDVTDFATPVRFIDVYSENGDVKVVAEVSGEYEYIAYQSNNEYIISVSPVLSVAAAAADDEFAFSGEKISLNFQDIDVRAVLQILADFNEFSLVVSDTVSGNITLRLVEVPWDQALDLVLRSRALDQRLVGNVLYVAPADEIASTELQELESSQQVEALAPMQTEYLTINYAVASEILTLLDSSSGGGMLSERGTASVDARTNILIVRDTVPVLQEIKAMLRLLDVPVRQVLIEARIVNAETSFSKALGVRWGGLQTLSTGDRFVIGGDIGSVTGVTEPGLLVDLATNGASSSIALGYAGNKGMLQLELSALEDSGNGEVVAQPKVTTQDQQLARIESGLQIPYQAQAGGTAGGSTTEFVDAVLSLEVTPQITPDGRIIMLLDIHQDSVVPGIGGVPAIATNSITTRVLVGDGETIVLGGVFREEVLTTVSKTAVLGDLPYVGGLFKRTEKSDTKTELLIFITPSIINDVL